MTTAEFQQKFPKPWRFVACKAAFSLRAANGQVIGSLQLYSHSGMPDIPINEKKRHIASVLSEIIQVSEEPEPTAAQQRAQAGKKSVFDDFEQRCKTEGFDPYANLPADG